MKITIHFYRYFKEIASALHHLFPPWWFHSRLADLSHCASSGFTDNAHFTRRFFAMSSSPPSTEGYIRVASMAVAFYEWVFPWIRDCRSCTLTFGCHLAILLPFLSNIASIEVNRAFLTWGNAVFPFPLLPAELTSIQSCMYFIHSRSVGNTNSSFHLTWWRRVI